MIKGIAHSAFTVTNMEKSLWFYCDVLGLKKIFEINDNEGKPWIVYLKVCTGQFVELFYASGELNLDNSRISYSHLCLEVDDIHEIADRIKKNGIKLDVEPVQGKDHDFQCWSKDPDGNRIEFMQMSPDSPQMKA